MTQLTQINKKLKVVMVLSLLTISSSNSFASAEVIGLGRNLAHVAKRQYKLIFDHHDHRPSFNWLMEHSSAKKGSNLLKSFAQSKATLPSSVNILTSIKDHTTAFPAYDQGGLGSCTANTIGGATQFDRIKQGLKNYVPSRLMIYYLERQYRGTIKEDSGASLSDGIRAMIEYGTCPEILWKYSDGPTQFKKKPTKYCFDAARDNMDLDDVALAKITQTEHDIKLILSQNIPVIAGIQIYSSFESDKTAKTGIVPLPDTAREQLLGGHAIMLVGYDDAQKSFIVRNSWGTTWGNRGYCLMPCDYLTNPSLTGDLWMISKVGARSRTK